MKLPNLSYLMTVGELRYIQARFERAEQRNPDTAVGAFLPLRSRILCNVRGALFLSKVRAQRFYHYVNARTRYYDDVVLAAIRDGFKCIVNVGCGSDTRSHRFASLIGRHGVTVLECDQEEAIRQRERLAKRRWPDHPIQYMALDLDQGRWPALSDFLAANSAGRTLVMMEGVSPYVGEAAFRAFLELVRTGVAAGSVVAYDFKRTGAADDFGVRPGGEKRFRLPAAVDEVRGYHERLGFEQLSMELSEELSRRLQPGVEASFREDALVKLRVRSEEPMESKAWQTGSPT